MKTTRRLLALVAALALVVPYGFSSQEDVAFAEDKPQVAFTAEVYTEDTQKNYQVPMHYEFDIDIQGNVYLSVFSDEVFYADSASTRWRVEMPPISCSTTNLLMRIDDYMNVSDNSSATSYMNRNRSKVNVNYSSNLSILYAYGKEENNNKTLPVRMYSGLIAKEQVYQLHSTVYTDTDGRFFIKNNDGSKNYFSETLTIECNGVTITKAIGSDAEGQASEVNETDEAKIARLESEKAKLQNNLETVQSQLSSLQSQISNLEGQLYEAQTNAAKQSGDINRDGLTNASDAAVILIYAAYVGAGGTLELPEWLDSPYRWNATV